MTGTKIVFLYGGHLAKSGKTVIEFAGHKLNHLDKVIDKSALLVHNETGIVVRAYARGTDRSVILDDLAENVEKLEHFLENPDEYEVQERPKAFKVKTEDEETTYDTYKEPSYSRSGKFAHLNEDTQFKQEYMLPIKKSYDVGKAEW